MSGYCPNCESDCCSCDMPGGSSLCEIIEICLEACENHECSSYRDSECTTPSKRCSSKSSYSYHIDGISCFNTMITPLSGLNGFSNMCGCVQFKMRRKNKTVSLQWEPFSGDMASSGVAYLSVSQTICNAPPYPMEFPLVIIYKGVRKITYAYLDPFAHRENLRFYLNIDGSGTDINIGDNVNIPGQAITWIVN
jgi:hypothetical protein